ncbi:Virginiamycin B lyase [uncultured archaeon]|nr:Virginiamycin B lyase [uncultured archaeon]
MGKFMHKAQGTIEYLVILSVIIIVSLIVVGLVSSNSQTEQISYSSGQVGTLTSSGIVVIDALSGADGNGLISLQNNSSENLFVTDINVGDSSSEFDSALIAPGSRMLFGLNGSNCGCTTFDGKMINCSVSIKYVTVDGLVKTKTLYTMVSCSESTESAGETEVKVPLDIVAPSVTLSSPAEGYSSSTSAPVDFNFYVSDNNNVARCVLKVDGSEVRGINTVANNSYNLISSTLSNFSAGSHSWNISCTDYGNNSAVDSSARTISYSGLSTPYAYFAGLSGGGSASVSKVSTLDGSIMGTYSIGTFADVNGVAVDMNGNIWVAGSTSDGNGLIVKMNGSTGDVMGSYSIKGNPPASATHLAGIAVDYANNIWVTNFSTNAGTSVSKVNGSTGALIGTYYAGPGPRGICAGNSNTIWVTLNGFNNYGTMKFNAQTGSGSAADYYGSAGGIAVDRNGNIWIANTWGGVTKLLGSNGTLVASYSVVDGSVPVMSDNTINSIAIAVDAGNNVWVSSDSNVNFWDLNEGDPTGAMVSRFNANDNSFVGTYLLGAFEKPRGIAVDGNGNIWVSNGAGSALKLDSFSGAIVDTVDTSYSGFNIGDFTGFAVQYVLLGKR